MSPNIVNLVVPEEYGARKECVSDHTAPAVPERTR